MSSRKAVNKILASSLLVSGLLAWGFAGYFAVKPSKAKPNVEAAFYKGQEAQKMAECESTARNLHFDVFPYVGKDAVRFYLPLQNNQLGSMAESSVLQASCLMPLQYYCIGTSNCYMPGVTLIFGKDTVPHVLGPAYRAAIPGPRQAGRPGMEHEKQTPAGRPIPHLPAAHH